MATVHRPRHGRIVGNLSCQKDSYLRSLDAEVLSCLPYSPPSSAQTTTNSKSKKPPSEVKTENSQPSWLLEFSDCVLFPEGGGQPTDHGTLTALSDANFKTPIDVDFIERQGLRCVVHSPQPLPVGTSVRQEVDFERRWDLMQQHTGQHLLSAIMNRYDNLQTLGWGMGAAGEMNYVDLPRKLSDSELQEIQKKVNDVISQNLSITVETPDEVNTDKVPDDYDKDQGVIRVIKIGDLDQNTCCGTHLQQTSHVSLLLLGPSGTASKSRHRQFFIAGTRALNLASASLYTVREVGKVLSTSVTPPTDLISAVTRLSSSLAAHKTKETKLLHELATYEIERVKTTLKTRKNAFVYRSEPGNDFVKVVATGVKESVLEGCFVVLASGEVGTEGAVLMVGDGNSVEEAVAKVKELLPEIKGGGKGSKWQGKMTAWKKRDLEKLRSVAGV